MKNFFKEMDQSSLAKKLSYWKGDDSIPLKNITIGELLEQTAQRCKDDVAISVLHGEKMTYGEVLEKVVPLAAAFGDLGLKKGDHVALWGFNSIEWYLSFLAAFRAGLVVVNLNPLYQCLELSVCLKKADVCAIIMDEELGDQNFYNVLKKVIPQVEEFNYNTHIESKEVPLLRTVIMISKKQYKGTFRWQDLLSEAVDKSKSNKYQSEISPFDVCNLQFTSGTTSSPKIVQLTHHNLINAACIGGRYKRLYEKRHRICLQVPFFHSYGAIHGILSVIDSGCTVVLPSLKFSPNKSVDCIIAEKCSMVYGTPTMHNDLLRVTRERAAHDLEIFEKMSSVEVFHSGGAMCLPVIIQELKKYFKNCQFMSGYGMTETSATTFGSSLYDPDEILLSTVGHVVEHVEVKVINDNNEIVPFGVPGELCCRGFLIMKGYYKDPCKTAEILDNEGWLRTGDKFILLENGYGEIVGRIKDIIIRGGENIAPKEIEQLLINHEDIVDVQVYGVNDARLGEVVAAAVIKRANSTLNEQDIKKYCCGMIASYKIPQYVMFVGDFPKTATGKIQKVKLREITEGVFNLGSNI